VKVSEAEDQQGRSPFLIDPGQLRSRWLAGLTRASDHYLRSRWFSGAMRLGFAALRGTHCLHTSAALLLGRGHRLDENPTGSGAARRT
jgi:hypothetical protein